MTSDFCDALWPSEDPPLALRELAELSGLSETDVVELVEYGALAPAGAKTEQWVFSVGAIAVARTARRLGDEFALEPHAVALLLAYLDRIHDLEAQLRAARARGTFAP